MKRSQHLARARSSHPSRSPGRRAKRGRRCDQMQMRPDPVFTETASNASLLSRLCSYQGQVGGAAGGGRRQRHLWKPRQTDQVRHQADEGRWAKRGSPHGASSMDLNAPSSLYRCSRVQTGTSKPSTRPPPPPSAGRLCRLTARSTSSQVGPFPTLGPHPLASCLSPRSVLTPSSAVSSHLSTFLSRCRQTEDQRRAARHPVRLHRALGVHQRHPEEEPDSALRNGLRMQGKAEEPVLVWNAGCRLPLLMAFSGPQITRCTSIPCLISSPSECLWTDWVMEKAVYGEQAKHFACIKRSDDSCAWYRGVAPPKKDFMDIEDP